jgi:hypothetical protein
MKIEVSIGEVIDKLSILEIKKKNIQDINKQKEIQKEIYALNECHQYIHNYPFWYQLLIYINNYIWELTDKIQTIQESEEYAIISKIMFELNQKRFRIKSWFNQTINSNIKEQKNHPECSCTITIPNEEIIYHKIAEINYLLLKYDNISFDTIYQDTIRKIFHVPTYTFSCINNNNNNILINDFILPEIENRRQYEFIPIKYISGGAFGDFIQQLSVINEMYYMTGRKGIVYISEKSENAAMFGDIFRYGLQNTYNDTYSLLMKQPYIIEYHIYNEQPYEINLNNWRINPSLYHKNWYDIFKETYQIEWGKHKWLNIPIDIHYKEFIFINTIDYRWSYHLDYNKLYSIYGENLVYISSDKSQYDFFISKTGLNIRYFQIQNFEQLCILINSCKLFIGGMSAPLAIAHALHKDRICGLSGETDDKMVKTLDKIWNNIKFTIMKGIFYNSKKALCSIWESGKMCYDILSKSSYFHLEYSEEYSDIHQYQSYDFIIVNYHIVVNNWITQEILNKYKNTFCIVTEVGLGNNVLDLTPNIFKHYIVLDPTIVETNDTHGFSRPLENIEVLNKTDNNSIPKIGSFGFATHGKEWHKIVECVQHEFDDAEIFFNIPQATYVPDEMHNSIINDIYEKCNKIIYKSGIKLFITHDILSKNEIIDFCKNKTINIFFYNRNKYNCTNGLSAVTDQAIVSEQPLLVSDDITFRHIHQYIDFYPNITIKDAIIKNKEGVLQMKKNWSLYNFLSKFEKILYEIHEN